MTLGSAERREIRLISVKLFSKNSNACDHNPPTLQADRQTDRRTDKQTTRGRVRAGPSFQLGTLSTGIANDRPSVSRCVDPFIARTDSGHSDTKPKSQNPAESWELTMTIPGTVHKYTPSNQY